MPGYTYACPRCGKFEVYLPLADYRPVSKCPQCAEESPRAILEDTLSTEGSMAFGKAQWSDGKIIAPLGRDDPGHIVTSERQLGEVCQAAGLDRETGQVVDEVKYNARLAKYRAAGKKKA